MIMSFPSIKFQDKNSTLADCRRQHMMLVDWPQFFSCHNDANPTNASLFSIALRKFQSPFSPLLLVPSFISFRIYLARRFLFSIFHPLHLVFISRNSTAFIRTYREIQFSTCQLIFLATSPHSDSPRWRDKE